jgi:hypothetical protein
MPRRRLRRRADHGTVFVHGQHRWLVTKRENTTLRAEPADLLVGRITTLVDRLRLQRRRNATTSSAFVPTTKSLSEVRRALPEQVGDQSS